MIYNNSYEEYSNELILEKKYNLSLSVGKDTKTCKLETNERIIINKTHYEIINSDNTSVCNYYCLNDSKNKTILSCSKNEFMTVGSNASNNFFFLFYSKEINKTNVSVDKGLNVLKECISGANYFFCCIMINYYYPKCSIVQSSSVPNWEQLSVYEQNCCKGDLKLKKINESYFLLLVDCSNCDDQTIGIKSMIFEMTESNVVKKNYFAQDWINDNCNFNTISINKFYDNDNNVNGIISCKKKGNNEDEFILCKFNDYTNNACNENTNIRSINYEINNELIFFKENIYGYINIKDNNSYYSIINYPICKNVIISELDNNSLKFNQIIDLKLDNYIIHGLYNDTNEYIKYSNIDNNDVVIKYDNQEIILNNLYPYDASFKYNLTSKNKEFTLQYTFTL